jgi:hypothetical protein
VHKGIAHGTPVRKTLKFLTDNSGKMCPKPDTGRGGGSPAAMGAQKNLPSHACKSYIDASTRAQLHTLPRSGPAASDLHVHYIPSPAMQVDGHRAVSRPGRPAPSRRLQDRPIHSVSGGGVYRHRPAEGPGPSVSGEFPCPIRHGGSPRPAEASGCAHEPADRVVHVGAASTPRGSHARRDGSRSAEELLLRAKLLTCHSTAKSSGLAWAETPVQSRPPRNPCTRVAGRGVREVRACLECPDPKWC